MFIRIRLGLLNRLKGGLFFRDIFLSSLLSLPFPNEPDLDHDLLPVAVRHAHGVVFSDPFTQFCFLGLIGGQQCHAGITAVRPGQQLTGKFSERHLLRIVVTHIPAGDIIFGPAHLADLISHRLQHHAGRIQGTAIGDRTLGQADNIGRAGPVLRPVMQIRIHEFLGGDLLPVHAVGGHGIRHARVTVTRRSVRHSVGLILVKQGEPAIR